jgi:hypothetical protein
MSSLIFDGFLSLMENNIRKIGVFTSGGDAPGMNAAIRAVVRACTFYKKEAYGIMRGYEGMIEGDFVKLGARSVGNIIQRGGTILKSARSEEFRTAEGRKKAYENLTEEGIEALVALVVTELLRDFINFLKNLKFRRFVFPEQLITIFPEQIIP